MSDEIDRQTEQLMGRLSTYGHGLAVAMLALPVPIEVPHSGRRGLVDEALPAMIRAYDIITEQPIPEQQQALAAAALLHWITAAELIIGFTITGRSYRGDGALVNMLSGEQILADLMEWLVDPEGGEAPDED